MPQKGMYNNGISAGNRYQMALLPKSIEDYVGPDDPVRVYDAFVDALDFEGLGIEIDPRKVGNAEYDPKTMLKLFSIRLFLWLEGFP